VAKGYPRVARRLEWILRPVEARVTRRAGRSSWGWAITVTTLLANLMLLPFHILGARNASLIRNLKPQIDAINARYNRKGLDRNPAHSREISELEKSKRPVRSPAASPRSRPSPSSPPFIRC
jgi:membrane protein insertase Oxa1/YidC/SpoIIIJ